MFTPRLNLRAVLMFFYDSLIEIFEKTRGRFYFGWTERTPNPRSIQQKGICSYDWLMAYSI